MINWLPLIVYLLFSQHGYSNANTVDAETDMERQEVVTEEEFMNYDGDGGWFSDIMEQISNSVREYVNERYDEVTQWFKGINSDTNLQDVLNDAQGFLNRIKQDIENGGESFMADASDQIKQAVGNIQPYLQEVHQFQAKVQNATEEELPRLSSEWQVEARRMYNDGLRDLEQALRASVPANNDNNNDMNGNDNNVLV